jgi:anaerobic selenocysteine-containing dehydrogenase
MEFSLYATKIRSKKAWDPEGKRGIQGRSVNGWEEFRSKGVINSPKHKPRALWEKGFPTETKKFEFYSETLKKVLIEHAEKHKVSIDEVLRVTNYEASGERAFVPITNRRGGMARKEEFPFDLLDMKSRFNREGRSANLPWYYTFKKCDPGDLVDQDVIQINPADAVTLGIAEGDMVRVTSVIGSLEVRARLWEGVQPGTVAKCFGQGHWAYGRVASKDFAGLCPAWRQFQ